MMLMVDEDTKALIIRVAESLQGVCDGARTVDCTGYNKMDVGRVADLLERIRLETSSPQREQSYHHQIKLEQELSELRHILIKYKKQILGMGLDYDKLVKANFITNRVVITPALVLPSGQTVRESEVRIYTEYNADFVKELKEKTRCWWNKDLRVWACKLNDGRIAGAIVLRYYPDAEIPPVPAPIIQVPKPLKPKGKVTVLTGYKVKVVFDFDRDLVEDIKSLRKRRWDAPSKSWEVFVNEKQDVEDLMAVVKKYNLEMTMDVVAFLQQKAQEFSTKETSLEASKATSAQITIPNLKPGLDLFPFQKAGVQFLDLHNGRALIADEMGLGKTIQALGWLQLHPLKRPAMVICPASLKENWYRETMKWLNPDPKVQIIKSGEPITAGKDVYIINYDIVAKNMDKLVSLMPSVLILDECHYIKNYKAARTKAIITLSERAKVPHVVALSGTPLLNRPIEIFTTLQIVRPDIFRSFWNFATRYADAHKTEFGWDMKGAAHLDELQKILRENVMIRRLKKDVLSELPEKQRNMVMLEASGEEWKDYVFATANIRDWLLKKTGDPYAVMKAMRAEWLVKINELRQLAAKAKMEAVEEWIDNFLESTDEKIVIFAWHNEIIRKILDNPKYRGIAFGFTGEDPVDMRQRIVDIFTDTQKYPNVRILVTSFLTGGVGLNLQVANNVAMLELPWRPADLQQAEDRVHRIGQRNQVTVWYLLLAHTIDEKMAETLNEKMKISGQALDSEIEESVMKGVIQFILGE